ncbi:MAG TPA: hypothetical protein PKC21_07875 [Oligoflexia bacterium]|nr:hypothetical protein [Oligoflexia bacterium]HMR25255.1 hypothetical protein [Oligoflexia bacterium]
MMIKYKSVFFLIAMVLCAACKLPQSDDVISKQHRQSYQCGLAMAGFMASLSMDGEHLRLILNDFEIGSDEPQSPFLEFQDLMKNSDYLLFESTDNNGEHINHTWQLLEIKQEGGAFVTHDIAKEILESKNLHVALVRIAFHSGNGQAHDEQDDHEDHSHNHDDHDHDQVEDHEYEGAHISFAVYQQLRGQRKPSWCKVTAPVQIEQEGNAYQVQVLKSAQAQVAADADHGHPGHSHQH